jgi:pyruvate,orthophosphate dikinase
VSHKYVYAFTEGNGGMRNLLGGKGANLAEMTNLGMPVPQGFTISTEACTQYYEDGKNISDNPLLVSVRSGARASMPGMMDTILNLGLNDEAVEGLAKLTNNARFAYDSYRRFIQMFPTSSWASARSPISRRSSTG